MPTAPPALFVAWRDPGSHRIFAVGRLLRISQPFDGYEFAYIQGAIDAAAVGFVPFLAFPDLGEVYRSSELPPFFKNRVLSPSRPDYGEYVETLALDPATADPVTILAISGGGRATDKIEVFPDLVRDAETGQVGTRFLVRGVQYVPGAEEHIVRLEVGERLFCMLDVQNPVNPEAIALRTAKQEVVGFLPDYLAKDVHLLLKEDPELLVRVERINLPPAPRHHRLLCSLKARAGQAVSGYGAETFRPISPNATHLVDTAPTPEPPMVASG